MTTRYGFSVNIRGQWHPVGPTGGDPYRYDTADEAKQYASLCYGSEVVGDMHFWRIDVYDPESPETDSVISV